MRRHLVLLDDMASNVVYYRRLIERTNKPHDLEIHGFSNDSEAAAFVASAAPEILGYVQDLYRDPLTPEVVPAGLRFLSEVIVPMTPWARTIFVSGRVDSSILAQIHSLMPGRVAAFTKPPTPDSFTDALAWLLEGYKPASVPLTRASAQIFLELDPPWDELRAYIAKHPEFLHQMDPRIFEHLIARIFSDYGWTTDLTKRTRDGGYDIVALRREFPTSLRVLVEAKRFSPDRAVSVSIVRSLYGIGRLRGASKVMLATSSYVSRAAKLEFADTVPWQLEFIEREQILAWCRNTGAVQLVGFSERPAPRHS